MKINTLLTFVFIVVAFTAPNLCEAQAGLSEKQSLKHHKHKERRKGHKALNSGKKATTKEQRKNYISEKYQVDRSTNMWERYEERCKQAEKYHALLQLAQENKPSKPLKRFTMSPTLFEEKSCNKEGFKKEEFTTVYVLDSRGNQVDIPEDDNAALRLKETFTVPCTPDGKPDKTKRNIQCEPEESQVLAPHLSPSQRSMMAITFKDVLVLDTTNDNLASAFDSATKKKYPYFIGQYHKIEEADENGLAGYIVVFSKKPYGQERSFESLNKENIERAIKEGYINKDEIKKPRKSMRRQS